MKTTLVFELEKRLSEKDRRIEKLEAEKAELMAALNPFANVPAANIEKGMFASNMPVEIEFDWDEKQWRVWVAVSSDAQNGCENIPKILDYDRARDLIAKAKEGSQPLTTEEGK